jgi:hypothetical protein
VASKTVDFVSIKYAIVTSLAQDLVAAVDAFQLCIIWQLCVMPAVGFCEGSVP